MIALAISVVAGVFGYYGVLVWRFFFDWCKTRSA
jgi:hypothetical protein